MRTIVSIFVLSIRVDWNCQVGARRSLRPNAWIVFWNPSRDLGISGDYVKAVFALTTSVASLSLATFVFGFVTAFWGSSMPQSLSHFRFLLTNPEDVSISAKDNIVIGLGFYNRIQIYNHKGQFQCGFFHETGGGRSSLFVDADGDIHVYPIRLNREFVYRQNGELQNSKPIDVAEWDRRRELHQQENVNRGVHSSIHKGLVLSTVHVQFQNQNAADIGTELWEIPFAPPFGQIGLVLTTLAVSWFLRLNKRQIRHRNGAFVRLPAGHNSAAHLCELLPCQPWLRPDRRLLGPAILFVKDDQCFCGRSVWDEFESISISNVRIQYRRHPFFGTARVTVYGGSTEKLAIVVRERDGQRLIELADRHNFIVEYLQQNALPFILKVVSVTAPLAFVPWSVPPVLILAWLIGCSLWSLGVAVVLARKKLLPPDFVQEH